MAGVVCVWCLVAVGEHSDGRVRRREHVSGWRERGQHAWLTAGRQEDSQDPVWLQGTQTEEASWEPGAAGVGGWVGHADVQTQVTGAAASLTECVVPGCHRWHFDPSLRYTSWRRQTLSLSLLLIFLLLLCPLAVCLRLNPLTPTVAICYKTSCARLG